MRKYLLIFLFSFINLSYAAIDCINHHCIALVDAGSSGSRLHIFSYELDPTNTPIAIKEEWSKSITPGISNIATNSESVESYLNNLFDSAPVSQLPIYFYATAGMRLLPGPKQDHYYSLINQWFDNQSQWALKDARTLGEAEEGLYGWLSVNYQLNALQNNSFPKIGVLDMGGASVEITFPVTTSESVSNRDIQNVELYGHHFRLFTHSFLGLGQHEVEHQFLNSTECFIDNYEMPSGEIGHGNSYQCKKHIVSLINNVHNVNNKIKPVLQTNAIDNWYVLGGLAELVKSKPFNFNEQNFTNAELLSQANTLCQEQWPVIQSQYPGNDYLYGYCLFPAYYYGLIVEGYGINPNQKLNYLPPNQTADWSLGFVLKQGTTK